MFDQYEPNVKTTISFLKQIKVKVNDSTVNETLQNHPDWPSMLCISDSLTKWNIPNGVGKIDVNDITQLPTPFIASFNNRETPLAIVTDINDDFIELIKQDYKGTVKLRLKDFLKSWQGVYLIAEPEFHSGEPDYRANKKKAFYNSLLPVAAAAVSIFFSLFLLTNTRNSASNPVGIYVQYCILFAGVVVTTALLWYEIDKNNPLLKKMCTGISKGNCGAILTGKQAKVFSWLSWSEVGFFYFTGAMLALIFVPNAITLIARLNILALPYTVFSIYYQWRVAKHWCVLCLAVQGLLLCGAANIITNNLLFPFPLLSIKFITAIILLLLLPVLIWYAIKPTILKLQEAKNTKREYLRIKFNTEIFDTLLKKQKTVVTTSEGLGIDMGNPSAQIPLLKYATHTVGHVQKRIQKLRLY